MKYDIWNAEYPTQVLMTDAIAGHTLPLWNPLFQYGTPFYSILGTPIWYPFTLALAFIGYTPFTIAVSYAMHIVFGGFGMFLLAKNHIKDSNTQSTVPGICASFAAGILYCGCGIFLANAQHIMIVISAAWIPYVFYYLKRYLVEKKFMFAMLAGGSASLILTGGYPELFFNLFLFLIPFTLYFNYKKEANLLENVVFSAVKYIMVCGLTIMAGAITLLPFLCNMGLITRGNGLGEIANGYTFSIILSVVFPKMTEFITDVEPSMVNFYMGIITILFIPGTLSEKNKYKKLYIGLSAVALMLCWGGKSFLHSLLYRFFPMYDSFRFPSLNRNFLMVFMLILVTISLNRFLDNAINLNMCKGIIVFSTILFLTTLTLAIIFSIITNFGNQLEQINLAKCQSFSESAYIVCFIIGGYLLIFYFIHDKTLSGIVRYIVVLSAVCIEVLIFTFEETPITISAYEPTAYANTEEVRKHIEEEVYDNQNRNREVNFAGNLRSTSGYNSKKIVFDKTFDEEGYLSFILSSIANFKTTYLRSIIEQNPIAYFTNNIVTSKDIDYDTWVNRCDVPPEQIYVDDDISLNESESIQKFNPEVLYDCELQMTVQDDFVVLEGDMGATDQTTGRIRLYFDDSVGNQISLNLSFFLNNGEQKDYQGVYQVNKDNGCYVEIFYPDINEQYSLLKINSLDIMPVRAKQVIVERMTEDAYVDVVSFGFNSIEIEVDAVSDGYMALLQTKHSGWNAYVDGEAADIATINGCFMGIGLKSGKHRITMKFQPKEFFVGGIITIVYWLLLLIICISSWKNMRSKRNGGNLYAA